MINRGIFIAYVNLFGRLISVMIKCLLIKRFTERYRKCFCYGLSAAVCGLSTESGLMLGCSAGSLSCCAFLIRSCTFRSLACAHGCSWHLQNWLELDETGLSHIVKRHRFRNRNRPAANKSWLFSLVISVMRLNGLTQHCILFCFLCSLLETWIKRTISAKGLEYVSEPDTPKASGP